MSITGHFKRGISIMIVAGIDPGKDGGYVELSEFGSIICILPLAEGLEHLLRIHAKPHHVFIEKAQVMARGGMPPGAVASFTYGQGFGEILGILRALRLPYTLVPPVTWTRLMHQGTMDDGKLKGRSYQAARRLFPGYSFLHGKRTKPHDGLFEAALIAEYGRRQLTAPPPAIFTGEEKH